MFTGDVRSPQKQVHAGLHAVTPVGCEGVRTVLCGRGRAVARLGKGATVEQVNAKSIFSEATGFIKRGGFDWTCNPYVGCSFGCLYCYAMFLPQNRRPREDWGKWFQAKANAVELARKQAPKVAGRAVYCSSVTDP